MAKNKTRTLVLLAPGFPADEQDVNCLPAQQLFVRAVNRNFPDLKLVIISFQYPFFSKKYDWYGNTVVALNGQNNGKIRRLSTWMKAWKTLRKLKRESDIIGILSFWCGECALLGKYFAISHKLPQFCWISGQDALDENKYVKWIRPRPSTLIAMSNVLADEFQRNFALRPMHIIHNGVDHGNASSIAEERSIDILGAGSLIPLKQYDIFIKVVGKLNTHGISLRSIICGEGIQHGELQMQIDEMGLQNVVKLKGEISRPELIDLMQQAKIFLHPSRYEGLSSACLEALAAGDHVVSFTHPGEGEIDHWHVVADVDAMTTRIVEILSDKETEYSPVTPFTMDKSAKEIVRLFS